VIQEGDIVPTYTPQKRENTKHKALLLNIKRQATQAQEALNAANNH
jgi:hypothetical protein